LAELLDDKTEVFRGGTVDARLGDHALAALVTAAGKQVNDYGLTSGISIAVRPAAQAPAAILTFRSFPNDDARQKGVKKWKDEAAQKDR
jgi:hypothetical protein